MEDGRRLLTFRGLVRRPESPYFGNPIAFRPDGRWIAAEGHDGRVVAWDAETGRDVYSLIRSPGARSPWRTARTAAGSPRPP